MHDILAKLKGFGSSLGGGMLQGAMPDIVGGVINSLFHQWNVDMVKITEKVQGNQPLWENIDPNNRTLIKELANRVNNLDFITPDWLIDSIRDDFPAVASMISSWPKAKQWLAEQIEELKKQTTQE